MLVRLDVLHQPGVLPVIEEAIRGGVFRGAEAGLFTNAHFHLPHELATQIEAAGFEQEKVFNVEGPGFLVGNFEERWADAERRRALLEAARIIESHPDMVAAASHLLAVAGRGR